MLFDKVKHNYIKEGDEDMILEIRDKDTLQALECLTEVGITAKVRDDREVTWIGDSLLQALFDVSETEDDMKDDIAYDIPQMASEIEWILFEGGDAKLSLMDELRKEYFYRYVRKRIIEMNNEKGVISIYTKL